MDSKTSVTEMLSRLEAQIAHNAERQAFHAGHEAFHRDQRSSYAEELERLTRCRYSLKAAAETADELMSRVQPQAPAAPPPPQMPDMGKRLRLARLIETVLERKAPHERFSPKTIAAEVNQTFGDRLKRRFSHRQASVALAWLAQRGRIVRHEKGRPFHESQYARRG
jgi:hypothetical protein